MIFTRIALLVSLLATALVSPGQSREVLSVDAFTQKLKATPQALVLDVRTPAEFAQGHLAAARNADWRNPAEFKQQVAKLDKSQPVFVYCQVGGRSKSASEWLAQQGFKKVYDLQGGYQAWSAEKELKSNTFSKPEKP